MENQQMPNYNPLAIPPWEQNEKGENMDSQAKNADEALLESLINEFGNESPEYTEEETKGVDFVREEGKYRCFVTSISTEERKRGAATKTKEAGSAFFLMYVGLKVVEDLNGDKMGGTLNGMVYFEKDNMRNYEDFCVSARVKKFETEKGMRRFPQAEHSQGGAVGMPIIAVVKMETVDKKKYEEVDGVRQLVEVLGVDGKPEKTSMPRVERYIPWETEERHTPEEKVAPETDINEDDF